MTFNQLRYVVETARIGSISKAAKHLLLTQPNLSSTIIALENELGIKLFIRSQDGVRLTTEGEIFMVHAQAILKSYENLIQLKDPKQKQSFDIGLLTPSSFCTNAFAKLCTRYHNQKNLQMSMQICTFEKTIDLLHSGQIDLGVILLSFPMKYDLLSLRGQKKIKMDTLGSLSINILLRKGHPLLEDQTDKEFNFSELSRYPCVDNFKNESGDNLLTLVMKEHHLLFPNSFFNTIFVTDRAQKDKILLSTDAFALGISRAPSHYHADIVTIPLTGISIELCLCTSPLYSESPLIPEFRTLLTEELIKSPDFISVDKQAMNSQ
ncbi:MAG: LysR family transcriptional regulator [Anaerolineaceae bacterium]|nr:LysR family transcriptional regulator [Anaerolineaceae bacterium]